MANDLITRLLLDSKQFDNNITKATREVQDFQKRTATLSKGFSSALGGITKFIPQLAAIGSVAGVVKAGFDGINNSSQSFSDGLDIIKRKINVTNNAFWGMVANGGSLSSFISKLGDLKKIAEETSVALDKLGSSEMFSGKQIEYWTAKAQDALADGNFNLAKQYIKNATSAFYNVWDANADAMAATLNESLQKAAAGIDGLNVPKVSVDDIERLLGIDERDLDAVGEYYKKKVDKILAMPTGTIQGYGDSETFIIDPKKVAERQKAMDELNALFKNDPIAAIAYFRTISNDAEQTVSDVISSFGKLEQTEAGLSKLNKRINDGAASTDAELKKTDKTLDSITKKANDLREFLQGGGNFTLSGNVKLLDDNVIKAILELPDEFAAAINDAFVDFKQRQDQLNLLTSKGLISQEEASKKEQKNNEAMVERLLALTSSSILTQDKKALTQTVVPIITKLISEIKNSEIPDANEYIKSVFNARKTGTESMLKSAGEGKYQEGDDINKVSVKLSNTKRLREQLREDKKYYESIVKYFKDAGIVYSTSLDSAKEMLDLVDKYLISTQGIIDELQEKLDGLTFTDKMMEWSDAAANWGESIGGVLDAVANRYDAMANKATTALKKKALEEKADKVRTASFVTETMSQIAGLISSYCSLAMAAGVSSGAKLPFPYNLAAVTTTVATLGAIIASAVNLNTSKKYANGGIVQGGSYSGDTGTVRVNAGEMILNGSQQANLFRLLNDGGFKSSGEVQNVTFKISGRDLVGTLKNNNNKYSKL